MKMIARWIGFCVCTVGLLGCTDEYTRLLNTQGYSVMRHPRTEFGTGTIIRVQRDQEDLLVAAPDECFPGIEGKIHPNPIQLMEAKDRANLSVDVGGKYVPGGAQEVGASLGFKRIANLDVSFGRTTGNDLTVEGFAQYMDRARVKKRCLDYLRDDRNRVLLSAARVESMAFTFHGERDVNAKVDDSALKNTLSANGVVQYTTTADHTLRVSQQMYIGYRSFKFDDLGIIQEESTNESVELHRDKFKLTLDSPR